MHAPKTLLIYPFFPSTPTFLFFFFFLKFFVPLLLHHNSQQRTETPPVNGFGLLSQILLLEGASKDLPAVVLRCRFWYLINPLLPPFYRSFLAQFPINTNLRVKVNSEFDKPLAILVPVYFTVVVRGVHVG